MSGGKWLTRETIQGICLCYRKGHKLKDIGQRYGINPATVSSVAIKQGMSPRLPRKVKSS